MDGTTEPRREARSTGASTGGRDPPCEAILRDRGAILRGRGGGGERRGELAVTAAASPVQSTMQVWVRRTRAGTRGGDERNNSFLAETNVSSIPNALNF